MINYLETHPGIGYTEVANIFSVNRRTLSKIHTKYKESGVVEDEKRGGPRSTKVQDIHLERIERAIEENPTITLKEIKILQLEEFQLSITEKTVSRTISKLGIAYKLTKIVPVSRNTEETIEKRYDLSIFFY
ncbi:hypothetical protein RF11_02947 [Thelohanellus kitauei]|uniref:Transposase Synechocystis PCC 6803 domain-containing protein n=1 Tax=Thelohanellus kitauei TaxID=669202 RepID=A0A0C2MVN4_THEKT|nr:hypothetical protein RF11_02947 [Thelohanellus kitauei]